MGVDKTNIRTDTGSSVVCIMKECRILNIITKVVYDIRMSKKDFLCIYRLLLNLHGTETSNYFVCLFYAFGDICWLCPIFSYFYLYCPSHFFCS